MAQDAGDRGWLHLALLSSLAIASCQAELQPDAAVVPRAAEEREPPAPVWSRFEDARGWPVVSEVFPSEHLGSARHASVRVSPDAEAAYRDLVPHAQLPEGAAVLEAVSSQPDGEPAGYFAMEKAAAGWTYWALDAEGRGKPDTSGLCQRCQAEAVADEMFGPRRVGTGSAPSATPSGATADAPSP